MTINHGLLCALGVGHPALTKVVETSARHGGMACKLTGAGGGGCAITLLPEGSTHVEPLRDALCAMGFDSYISKVGGHGVKWHVAYPPTLDKSAMRKGQDVSHDSTMTSADANDVNRTARCVCDFVYFILRVWLVTCYLALLFPYHSTLCMPYRCIHCDTAHQRGLMRTQPPAVPHPVLPAYGSTRPSTRLLQLSRSVASRLC